MSVGDNTASRPSGTVIVSSDRGTVEADTLQCVHCGKHWTVQRGSGKKRSFCPYHNGVTCGSPQCLVCMRLEPGMQHGRNAPKDVNPSRKVAYDKYQQQETIKAFHHNVTKGGIILP